MLLHARSSSPAIRVFYAHAGANHWSYSYVPSIYDVDGANLPR
ncbi:MAG TPA: hypothetical protein VGG17_08020 [Acidimicrobiales bacterium]